MDANWLTTFEKTVAALKCSERAKTSAAAIGQAIATGWEQGLAQLPGLIAAAPPAFTIVSQDAAMVRLTAEAGGRKLILLAVLADTVRYRRESGGDVGEGAASAADPDVWPRLARWLVTGKQEWPTTPAA